MLTGLSQGLWSQPHIPGPPDSLGCVHGVLLPLILLGWLLENRDLLSSLHMPLPCGTSTFAQTFQGELCGPGRCLGYSEAGSEQVASSGNEGLEQQSAADVITLLEKEHVSQEAAGLASTCAHRP